MDKKIKEYLQRGKTVFLGNFWPYFVIFILSLIPVFYTWGRLAIGGDIMIPFDSRGLEKYLYQWIGLQNGQYFSINYYPLYIYYKLIGFIGLNVYQISSLLLFLLNILAGFGIYKLAKLFCSKENKYLYIIPITFYLLSPALLNGCHYLYIYSFIPWFFYFIFKSVKANKIEISDMIWINVVIFFSSLDLPNPKYLFHFYFIAFIIYIFSLLFKLVEFKFFIKNFWKFFISIIFLFYLFLPLGYFAIHYSPEAYGVHIKAEYKDTGKMMGFGTDYTIDKIFKLHHDNIYLNGVEKNNYNSNKLVTIIGYIFIIILTALLLWTKKKPKINVRYVLLLQVLTLIYIWFAVGPNPPFGFFYEVIVTKITLLAFLRTTAGAVLYLSLFYALLIFFFVIELKRLKLLAGALIFVSILIVGYPLLNGQYYKNFNNVSIYTNREEYGFKIPDAYFAMKQIIDIKKIDAKYLHTKSVLSYLATKWGYFGASLYNFLYNNYNIGYDKIFSNISNHNIRYTYTDNSIDNKLEKPKSLQSVKKIDFLELDKVENNNFLPHFYTPQTIITTPQNLESLPEIVSQPDYKIRSAIYSSEQNKNVAKEVLDGLGQSNSKIIIVPETKTDKLAKLDEDIKNNKGAIASLASEDVNKLSLKDKAQLENLKVSEQALEQQKAALETDLAQFFVTVENGDNYNLSFQLLSCHEEGRPPLDNVPVITINDKSYDIPYEIVGAEENNKNIEKYKIQTDNDCFVSMEDIALNPGELKIVTNYIMGIDNLVFSKDYPQEIKTPVLEFKKVNPTKYIVRVHQVQSSFPLVFSESFHDGWKAYVAAPDNLKIQSLNVKANLDDQIANYKILDGNIDDQSSAEELKSAIGKGYISTLGDLKDKKITHTKWEDNKEKFDYQEKYRIDFISKNFQGTIQNDNLPSGSLFATWFKEPLPETDHLTANGYANSWWVDLDQACGSGKVQNCVKNPDGSYDFEMVVEFWPQRLFYIGLAVSGITLLGCLAYLAYDWRKNKKPA